MKVLVAVTDAAEVADDFEIEGTRVAERYVEYDLNEWDDYAVEEAVRIAESREGVEVVTATVGPERVEETIRMALAKGANRAIRVWDGALEGRDLLEVGTKAAILAAVVEREEPDLVLAGVQAADDAWGATGVALAAAVGFEWAAVVNDLELEGEVARVHRELEGGVEELAEVELPAVLTIQTGINEPRYASLRGIRGAQSKEIALHSFSDLGLDASIADGSLELTAMYEPEAESETRYFDGSPAEQAGGLAEVLRGAGVGAE